MNLEDAYELRDKVLRITKKAVAKLYDQGRLHLTSRQQKAVEKNHRSIAVGISRRNRRKDSYRVAVRIQRRELHDDSLLDRLKKVCGGEIDIRYIGAASKHAGTPWYQRACRPLQIGCSISHFKVSGGTLSCFVRRRADHIVCALSNNHVLANENRGTCADPAGGEPGDPVVQPANYDTDNGQQPATVGRLGAFVSLRFNQRPNLVDCAISLVDQGIGIDPVTIRGVGSLQGVDVDVHEHDRVFKIGRSSGLTEGRIVGFGFKGIVLTYDRGDVIFDDVLEIEPAAGNAVFSDRGDSGGLVVDSGGWAVGLVFGGADQGAPNGAALSYACPIQSVLDALEVDLVTH